MKYRICIETRANGTEQISVEYERERQHFLVPFLKVREWITMTDHTPALTKQPRYLVGDWPKIVFFDSVEEAKAEIDAQIADDKKRAGRKIVGKRYVEHP